MTEKHICRQCNNLRDTRPYGPGFSNICYSCAMDMEDIVAANFDKILSDIGPLAVIESDGVRRPTYEEAVKMSDEYEKRYPDWYKE